MPFSTATSRRNHSNTFTPYQKRQSVPVQLISHSNGANSDAPLGLLCIPITTAAPKSQRPHFANLHHSIPSPVIALDIDILGLTNSTLKEVDPHETSRVGDRA